MSQKVVLVLPFLLAGCMTPLQPADFANQTPEFRPDAFFLGQTRSTGVLETRSLTPAERFRVKGDGSVLPDGGFQLDQSISFEGKPTTTRRWVLRPTSPHHYTASLTDASGPVTAEAYGNLFHLRYPMKQPWGGRMEQWLYLQPDMHTVVNEATVTLFGLVTVAHLSERITQEAE